ncbi:MAG TPA: DUF58 domain-containing protein [Phycisphaerae bacterium]|nr:DUF58 domain-containing protein [Phycisphaerae bacterium]HNU46061.1 DUF58 domain-containing protein [Phycisphaerae bacterium]
MPSTARHYRKYLDPAVLAKIGGLQLRARLIVEGFFSGMHRSPQRGLSIEFADHRSYTQGDDIRRIDWRVYARTDKYYVKEYEQETNLDLMLVVDASESMQYRSAQAALSKYEYATAIAAALAYLALQQRDSVGLAVFAEHLVEFVRPSNDAAHWRTVVDELERRSGPAKTALGRALGELAERLAHRMLVVVISDGFDDVAGVLRGLKLLRYRRHDLVVCHVLDPAELTLPFRGPTLFEGLEAGGRLLADPGALRRRYLQEMTQFQARLRAGCARLRADYVLFNTLAPLDVALSTYLATRSARIRQRSSRVMAGR